MSPPALPTPQSQDVLTFARSLRAQGDAAGAAAVLDAALAQPMLHTPATTELSAQTGWLHLERAGLFADTGHLADADGHALAALRCFDRSGEAAGGAAACLFLGDLDWQAGNPPAAVGWWARARSLADAAGATPLAARALAAMALRELGGGDPEVADRLLETAQERAAHELAGALPPEDAAMVAVAASQADAVRASLALVRARRALVARNWPEARLLLAAAAEAARHLQEPGLYLDALRLDATLARRLGDPHGAVQSLQLATSAARRAGLERLAWLLDAELVLALADDEAWAEAFAVQEREPPEEIAAQPPILAARLESFAVLALHAGQREAALHALGRARQVRSQLGDHAAVARTAILEADAVALGDPATALQRADEVAQAQGRAGRPDLALDASLVALRAVLQLRQADAGPRAEAVLALSREIGSSIQQLTALDLGVLAKLQSGDAAGAVGLADEALDLASTQPLLRSKARAQARKAQAILAVGDAAAAVREAGAAADLADEALAPLARVVALTVAGRALTRLGRADEAALTLAHAQSGAMAARRPDLAAEAAFELGNLHATLHAWAEARHAFGHAMDQALSAGLRAVALDAKRGLALCRRHTGDVQGAAQDLQATRHEAERAGLPLQAAACTVDLAQLLTDAGDLTAAAQTLQRLDLPSLPPVLRGEARTLLGRLRAQQGQPQEAATILQAAVADLRQADAPRPLGAALLLLGQVEGMLGHGQACGELLSEALLVTTRHGLPEQQVVRRVIERLQAQAAASR